MGGLYTGVYWWGCTLVSDGDRGRLCASPVGYAGAGEGRDFFEPKADSSC